MLTRATELECAVLNISTKGCNYVVLKQALFGSVSHSPRSSGPNNT